MEAQLCASDRVRERRRRRMIGAVFLPWREMKNGFFYSFNVLGEGRGAGLGLIGKQLIDRTDEHRDFEQMPPLFARALAAQPNISRQVFPTYRFGSPIGRSGGDVVSFLPRLPHV